MIDTEQRPVFSGILALVAVAVVVGALGGLGMLVGVKALGFDGQTVTVGGGGESGGATLVLPEPTETETSTPPETGSTTPEQPTESQTPQQEISLSAGQTSVAPMQQIDLTGTYPTGEGAVLQVQRLENGTWADFPVTVSVSGAAFGTYVLTSRPGENRFRVIDTDTQTASNPVVVTVG